MAKSRKTTTVPRLEFLVTTHEGELVRCIDDGKPGGSLETVCDYLCQRATEEGKDLAVWEGDRLVAAVVRRPEGEPHAVIFKD